MPDADIAKAHLTLKDFLSVAGMLLSGAIWAVALYYTSQGKIDVLTYRTDNVEKHVQSIDEQVRATHDTVIELRAHQARTGDQLNRIENTVRGAPPPFVVRPAP